MNPPPAPAAEQDIPWLQRLFENIWFLLAIGVILPTLVYTGWSLVDLALLPQFGEQPSAQIAAHTTSGAASPVTAGPTVAMKNMAFQTKTLEIAAGTTVTWINEDPFPHSVASGTPSTPDAERLFQSSGDFGQGGSFSYRFDALGTYPVYCATPGHYAAGMTMTVVVTEAAQ